MSRPPHHPAVRDPPPGPGTVPRMEHAGADRARLVVAAAVVDDVTAPTHLLAARRSAPSDLAGQWELPGGKVEPGEDPAAALHREISEELGVTLTLGRAVPGPLDGDWPITPRLRLRVWLAATTATPVPLVDHDALRWVTAADWHTLPWLPADRPIIPALGLRAHMTLEHHTSPGSNRPPQVSPNSS